MLLVVPNCKCFLTQFSNTKKHYDITRKYEKHEKIKPQQLQKITIKNS